MYLSYACCQIKIAHLAESESSTRVHGPLSPAWNCWAVFGGVVKSSKPFKPVILKKMQFFALPGAEGLTIKGIFIVVKLN